LNFIKFHSRDEDDTLPLLVRRTAVTAAAVSNGLVARPRVPVDWNKISLALPRSHALRKGVVVAEVTVFIFDRLR
jgi:hypothetical protein